MNDKNAIDPIRFCAFCPNLCRFYYPTTGILQRESMAPSALCYLAYAVTKGFIAYTKGVATTLSRLEAAERCKEACCFNLDIPAELKKFIDRSKEKVVK